jgi:hypothetical protein
MGQNIPLADNGKGSILGTSPKVKKRVVPSERNAQPFIVDNLCQDSQALSWQSISWTRSDFFRSFKLVSLWDVLVLYTVIKFYYMKIW